MAKPLKVVILGDATDALRALGKVETAADKTSTRMQRVGDKMSGMGRGLSIGLTAPIIAGAGLALQALGEIERISAQTDAAIESTGGAANVTRQEIEDYAGSLEKLTSVEAETIQEGQNLLLTFTNVKNEVGDGNDVFNQATEAALDMSVAMGTDMSSASMLVGKALNDPVKGLTALSKSGVQFTADQKKMITEMVEAGDTMGAQKIILGELTTQFGGSGEALGETMVGKIAKAKNAFGEMTETLASALMPAIETLTGWFQSLADWFNNLSPASQKVIGVMVAIAAAIGPVLIIGGKLVSAFGTISKAFSAMKLLMMANPWVLLIAAVVALVTIIVLNWDKIVAFLKKAWDWIVEKAAAVGKWLKDKFKDAVEFLYNLFLNFTPLGLIIQHFDKIKELATGVGKWIKDKFDAVVEFFKKLPGRISSAVSGLWDGLKTAFKSALNWLIDKWNNFHIPAVHMLGVQVTPRIDFPNIPRLHSGTRFFNPPGGGDEGLALLQRGEQVTPRGQAAASVINLTVYALDPRTAGRVVVEALQDWQRANGAIPITVRS